MRSCRVIIGAPLLNLELLILFLGFVLTWLTVSLSQGEEKVMMPVTALWFVCLPLFDKTATILRRLI